MMTSHVPLGPRPEIRGEYVAVKLGNPLGPYAQEYIRDDLLNQRAYLVDLGFNRGSASAAVNMVHDTNVYVSDLYQGTKHPGLVANFVDVPESRKQRAVLALIDEERYREAVLRSLRPYNHPRGRAAAELLLRLAELEPLDS